MIGAIIGDIAGSIYERSVGKPLLNNLINPGSTYTDDSVLTIAIAHSLIELLKTGSFADSRSYYQRYLWEYGNRYKNAGYGFGFLQWLNSKDPKPYHSFGNGSAMRVGPIGCAFSTLKETLEEAEKSAEVTHNHPDGIKGAQAVAGAVFLARNGEGKESIKRFIVREIGYNLSFDLEELHRNYRFEIKCSQSVPQAVFAFLVSNDFKDAIRKALYIGGDADTIACITGSISEAHYRFIPDHLVEDAKSKLDEAQKKILFEFENTFNAR